MARTCALYARYSTDKQQVSSILDQFRICRERAQREGWEVVECYSDEAISGASLKRPGLQALLTDAKAGRFEIVVCEALDRIAGDIEYSSNIVKHLTIAGVQLIGLSEGPIGQLQVGMFGTFGAMRLIQSAEKTHRGQKGRAIAGKLPGGKAYGYDVVKAFDADGNPVRGERVVNTTQAAVVNRIGEMFADQKKSPEAIATQLNAEGIPGPRGEWSAETIRGSRKRKIGILNNEMYVGKLVWNKLKYHKNPDTMGDTRISRQNDSSEWVVTDIPHLRLMDDDLWERIKARQDELTHKPFALRKAPPKLFSYLLRCGECGGGMAMISRTKYGCSRSRKRGVCQNRLLKSRDEVETLVLRALRRLLPPELCEQFCRIYVDRTNRYRRQKDATARDQRVELSRIDDQIKHLVDAIKSGVDPLLIRDEINAAKSRKEALTASLSANPGDEPILLPSTMKFYRANVEKLITLLENPLHREASADVLRKMIDKIVLTPNAARTDMTVDLYGDLAGILQLAATAQPENVLRTFVGSRNLVQASVIEQAKEVLECSRDHAALEVDPAVQVAMVAGVGFEPTTFRL